MTAAQVRAGSPVLRMVLGMASIFRDTPRPPASPNDVTDWLNARGGVVFGALGLIVVAWGAVSQVVG